MSPPSQLIHIKPGCSCNVALGQAANYARLYALRAAMWHVDAVLPHVEAATPADLQVTLRSFRVWAVQWQHVDAVPPYVAADMAAGG